MKEFVRSDILKDGVVNEENLDILCAQVIENSCYDKVGNEFYSIDKSMSYTELNRSPEIVADWLDHLETLKVTSKNIGYFGNIYRNHFDNPTQYDKNGHFISGTGEICPSCGVEWEDIYAVATCPCLDSDF